jgi:uncharacterized membrane protein
MRVGSRPLLGEPEVGPALERTTAFSDGVFAIAITLLVLNLAVPNLTVAQRHRLGHELLAEWHTYFAFALSFVIIARFWLIHHRIFSRLTRLDTGAILINFAYLAAVVLVPFATEVFGRYPGEPAAAITYAIVVGFAALFAWLLHRRALQHGLVDETYRHEAQLFGDRVALLRPALFFASIPLAFVTTTLSEVCWIAAVFVARGRR